MAFDLVHYFAEQIRIQKPQLLETYNAAERQHHLQEINVLSFGKLISLWRENPTKLYQEIDLQEALYIEEISRHLTMSSKNKSTLPKLELEHAIAEILQLQLTELHQLNQTGNLGILGFHELFKGQIEHLSGQADDWVWSTNNLNELKGSKPLAQEQLSLQSTIKEFNQMVNHSHDVQDHAIEIVETAVPTWSKIAEPLVAIAILWFLFCSASQMFA